MGLTRSVSDGYHDDFGLGRVAVDDAMLLDASVDGQGGTIRGKPVFTIDQASFQLNRGDGLFTIGGVTYESGAIWAGAKGDVNRYYDPAVTKGTPDGAPLTTIAFGFYETRATLPEPYQITQPDGTVVSAFSSLIQGFSALDADQRAAARDAIQSWDDLVSISFVEKAFGDADINFMNTTTGPAQASAYLPYDYGTLTNDDGSPVLNAQGKPVTYAEIAGDVFVNPNQASNHLFDEGQYGLTTLIHELGHTLGLEHPGAYNFSDNFSVNYENGAEYYQDSNQYSIMSYWDSEETGANHVDWALLTYRYSSTPSVHDVAAIQRIYGADMTTRTGDTVYGFNSNAGRDSYDFNLTPTPVMTIWDAGGNDTLDFSGFTTPSIIDLNEGAFSSGGGFYSQTIPTLDEINARRAEAGLAPRTQATYEAYLELTGNTYRDGLMTDNIAIAYGATIENAIGGSGNDLIIANQVANRLDGGAGIDTLSFKTATSGVTINLANGLATGGAAGDTFRNFENLTGSAFEDTLRGNSGSNAIDGGAGFDTYVLSGNRADYTVVSSGTGLGATITDRRAGGDGVDTIVNVERLRFADGSVGVDTLLKAGIINGVTTVPDRYGQLTGTSGNDRISGSAGNDRIVGKGGVDSMFGGAGNDTFIIGKGDFSRAVSVQDEIYDFSGAGGYSANDNDFLSLVNFGAGAKLVFDHYGATGNALDQHVQYYHIEAGGDVSTILVKSLNGQLLTQNDYAFYG
ncbi:M10 family metallopeptidase C-terminal domain-containing protein [Sphingomonas solaris]|uniref:Peptidase metallopeptidase domain-containing protein n=1 Tax=Alterirhizorhabdus solaris TaxID=2529389 RepID=A0A558QVB9_9SPHN|nr:M10 family metallopeptidase C-terminal domain-containing protein [Sphingomonas solaris]TVV71091.1 hypothetical protein FOY91_17625 [Sphingomonas solaris]